jgi:hypothetical protein
MRSNRARACRLRRLDGERRSFDQSSRRISVGTVRCELEARLDGERALLEQAHRVASPQHVGSRSSSSGSGNPSIAVSARRQTPTLAREVDQQPQRRAGVEQRLQLDGQRQMLGVVDDQQQRPLASAPPPPDATRPCAPLSTSPSRLAMRPGTCATSVRRRPRPRPCGAVALGMVDAATRQRAVLPTPPPGQRQAATRPRLEDPRDLRELPAPADELSTLRAAVFTRDAVGANCASRSSAASAAEGCAMP